MVIRELLDVPFGAVVQCFNEAFSDYFIPFQVEKQYMKRRWYASGVDYSLSFGAFEGRELVGIIITGAGTWLGEKTAYIAATGVIPDYRNRGILRRLFEVAIARYRSAGFTQSILEVIDQNKRAIEIYRKIGYVIDRKLCCFQGKPVVDPDISWEHLELKATVEPNWDEYDKFIEYLPTWDYFRIGRIFFDEAYHIYELHDRAILVGYIIVQPINGVVVQFGIKRELGWMERGMAMFDALKVSTEEIRVNNVEESAMSTIRLMRRLRLKNFLNQYEMKLVF